MGATLRLSHSLLLLPLFGCVEGLTQVAGTGSTYTVRCSSEMEIRNGDQYFAKCQPESCTPTYRSGPVSHVVVALEPGKRLVGYAERICIQDLAESSGLFNPGLFPQQEATKTPDENDALPKTTNAPSTPPVPDQAPVQQ
jgi:hypothetical protein